MVKIYYLLFEGNRGHAYILEVRAPHPFRQNYSLNYLIPSIVFAANTCRFPSEYRWKQFELAYQDVPPLQKWTNQRLVEYRTVMRFNDTSASVKIGRWNSLDEFRAKFSNHVFPLQLRAYTGCVALKYLHVYISFRFVSVDHYTWQARSFPGLTL